jgi:diguanylate cyclase (GGDEF)-like protein
VKTRRNLWIAAAIVMAVGAAAGSTFAALGAARNDGRSAHLAFVATSVTIATTLKLALQDQQDLVTSAGATVVDSPSLNQAQFALWTSSIRAFARYPQLQGISELAMIPASQLASFAASHVTDLADGTPGPNGSFTVTPAGIRPYYCLTAVTSSRVAEDVPAGLDYCTTSLGPALLRARASGQSAYLPYKSGKTEELAIGTAIYRGGVEPTTVPDRLAAFVGWIGILTLPGVVLTTALANHPSTAVTLRYGNGASKVSFHDGSIPIGAQSKTLNLHNGWYVEVQAKVSGSGLIANRDPLALLFGGVLLGSLLAALVFLLGTGRSRALQLVLQRTDELHRQAFHDALTGLPNRALILDRIDQTMKRVRHEHVSMATFFIDLDNFKDINDTLGHRSGDELLTEVGTRLKGALRDGDMVGRLGGDEFVIVTAGLSQAGGIEAVTKRILSVLEPPFKISGTDIPLSVTASIGIALGSRSIPEELLRDADIALYRAKAAGKSCAAVFTQSMQVAVDDHRNLDVDLHTALGKDQFFLLYQPTVEISSGAITGFEALLRWQHPTRGVVPPDEFIPALEASGMIVQVGRWVLDTACRQGAAWAKKGYQLNISVNVASAQLQRDTLADDLHSALTASGFDPTKLILELTETTLMHDVEKRVYRLQLLKAIGVRIAIDDFGTGFSSLARLQNFPIDIIKIDQSFVSHCEDIRSATFIRTFVQLGEALGLEVVAEGVETTGQRAFLMSENVGTGQGFLFARPLDVEAAEELLRGSVSVSSQMVTASAMSASK